MSFLNSPLVRINEIIGMGTGAVEIKSGYGLNLEDELKMLRVIRRIKETTPIEVKSTFLGAHAVPEEFRNDSEKYIDLIINEMILLLPQKNWQIILMYSAIRDFLPLRRLKGY